MIKTLTYKKLKNETETVMGLGDVLSIIEENLGSEVVEAILDFQAEESKEEINDGPNITKFIEDGIWEQQIEESGVIELLVKQVIADLDSQGYLKKNKSIDKFSYEDICYKELIDEELSPGIMNYFNY